MCMIYFIVTKALLLAFSDHFFFLFGQTIPTLVRHSIRTNSRSLIHRDILKVGFVQLIMNNVLLLFIPVMLNLEEIVL